MRLTGNAKELFTDYLLKYFQSELMNGKVAPQLIDINKIPESMLWGAIQDWADSIGYKISIGYNKHEQDFHAIVKHEFKRGQFSLRNLETTQEARNAAIDKLNEIVNGL